MKKEELETKNNNKLVLIAIIVLLLAVIGGVAFYLFKDKEGLNPDKKTKKVDVNPPNNITFNAYETMFDSEKPSTTMSCYLKNTKIATSSQDILKDDYIDCSISYNLLDADKVGALYFEFNYDNKLVKFLGEKESNDSKDKIYVDGNRIKIEFANKDSKSENEPMFRFQIIDDNSSKTTIKATNVHMVTNDDRGYNINDYSFDIFPKQRATETKFYIGIDNGFEDEDIYSETYEPSVSISEYKIDDELGSYTCKNNKCRAYHSVFGNYVLIYDGEYLAYNYVTEEVTNLNVNDKEVPDFLASDTKLYGYTTNYNDEYKYYGINDSKNALITGENYISFEDSFIWYYDKEYKLFGFDGKKFKPSTNESTRINDTEFYYTTIGSWNKKYFFFDSNGEVLGDYSGVTVPSGEPYAVSKDNTLLIRYGNLLKEYNTDGQLINTTQSYKDLNILLNTIFIIDENRYLKVIDNKGNTIVSIDEPLPSDYEIAWCVGDYFNKGKDIIEYAVYTEKLTDEEKQSYFDYENAMSLGYDITYDIKNESFTIIVSDVGGYGKPVLYLYPEKDDTNVTINFANEDNLTTTYPKFNKKWEVKVNKNGDIYDKDGKYYYGLYWEEKGKIYVDFSEGFYVSKDNAIDFLETKLTKIGLNARERNEFIMYWLPILEKNEHNLVYFELTKERESFNKIFINPAPDSLLRVAIHVKKVDGFKKIKEEKLETFNRTGFSAVEWGGVVY